MKRSKKIIIPLKGISDGRHNFDFQIFDEFYKEYPESEVLGGRLSLQIQMDKKPHLIEVFYEFNGFLQVLCDKCLDAYDQEIDGNGMLYVKFGEAQDTHSEELIYLPDSESELDLTHFMYESTNLSLPYRRVHPDDSDGNATCDPEMLAKLNAYKTGHKSDTDTGSDEIDPRWEKLRQLRDSN
ncbi:MAG: hypothetical protein GVY19_05185 [Bacteroidetes bacterium]|jgi:uncharacterized metal-binding protein YceD (DUF177 family)|nr:hypothetical protein [Bacteroidota bacterium]